VFFYDLSEADALAYRDHVIRRGPARVSDLAHHMAETGGPVELMDASVESLEPFWEWFAGRLSAGLPEVSSRSVPSMVKTLSLTASEFVLKAAYAIEPMSHYLLELISAYSPDAHWDVHELLTSDDGERGTTVVVSSLWRSVSAEEIPLNQVVAALRNDTYRDDRDSFRRVVERILRLDTVSPVAPRPGSILTPYLSLPRVPLGDAVRVPPVVGVEVRVDPHPERESWSDQGLQVADLDADVDAEDLTVIRPLDEGVFAAGLTALGCHRDGAPVTSESLRDEGTQILWRDSLIEIGPVVEGGRLRILNVKPIRLSDAEWDEFEAGITRLAAQHHAQLGTYDMFGPHRTEQ
jgi:hypothetical protein